LGLNAQGLRLERSTPVEAADFKKDFEQLLGLCGFNASILDLLELTSLPQKDQNSEHFTYLTTFWSDYDLDLIFGLEDGGLWMFWLVFWVN
jgi:hypothetical protein